MEYLPYAIVVDGIVFNCVLWDGNDDPSTGGFPIPENWTMVVIILWKVPQIGLGARQGEDGVWMFEQPDGNWT
ncbi:hypothetical protein [Bradyrhizobium sp. 613_E4_N2_2]|uniref:hypothetical protein n=1 Tax=Bradyrhizobium sp. 613_E4_N2_2 TaxID=3240371 RepID=UPI003F8AE451